MLKRTITGVALIAVLVVVLLFLPKVFSLILVAFMAMMATDELLRGTGLVDNQRLRLYAAMMAYCIVQTSYLGNHHGLLLLCVLVGTVLCFSEMLRTSGKLPFQQVAMTMVAGLLIPFLLSALVRIRVMENGVFFIAAPFVMAFLPDTGAYLIGCAFGKHKLCPLISPKKTVEGAIGGLVGNAIGGLVFAFVMNSYLGQNIDYLMIALVGVLCSVVAQLGDLSFSLIKREFGIKDYGKLFLAHGGVLDRFDSVLFVAPVLALMIPFVL